MKAIAIKKSVLCNMKLLHCEENCSCLLNGLLKRTGVLSEKDIVLF